MNIGIAGTGRMGAAIAQRLLGLGHTVRVWNRTREKAAALESEGAQVCATPAALAGASEVIVTMLTDAAAIERTYSAPDGLLAETVRGKTFIEMSTVRPETERALAARIAAKGGALIECPVGGTVGPARDDVGEGAATIDPELPAGMTEGRITHRVVPGGVAERPCQNQ